MRVFVTGGTGHSGSYIILELIAAGHEVTGLAWSDTAAAAASALGAKAQRRRGDLAGSRRGSWRRPRLPTASSTSRTGQGPASVWRADAVSAAELPVMLAYGEALEGTGKPLVAAWAIRLVREAGPYPTTEEDPALPVGDEHGAASSGFAMSWKPPLSTSPSGECGLRSCGLPTSCTARPIVFLLSSTPIALARRSASPATPGDGANLWNAAHARDVAPLFRLALEKGPGFYRLPVYLRFRPRASRSARSPRPSAAAWACPP